MIDFQKVPSPSYLLDEQLLDANLALIDRVRREAGVEIIVALKACAMWSIFPELARHSDGATASSPAEARLVLEEYGQPAHTYAPVYTDSTFEEIMACSSHITFNSIAQYERFAPRAILQGISCGVRINPKYSPVETDLYNPCVEGSRLGVTAEELTTLPAGVEGLHFHVLCESRPHHLKLALEAVEHHFGPYLDQIKWLNMGGGHLMTHAEYDCDELIALLRAFKARHPHLRLILEPGSAFTWRTGYLVSTVEDVVRNGGVHTAMLDVSFACHMPDCLEMPYKPAIIGGHEPEAGEKCWRMGGNSCLAGDYYGDWAFDHELQVGERIVFEDM
ncbi:MAG: carboxynorspermidine decarboxylase, partial [Alistipes sp.]|nr:carboxynorspermidine decarboxylase [Alistipes sp.]